MVLKQVNMNGDFSFTHKNLPTKRTKIPLQTNGSDCGVFLLQFLENFIRNPDHNEKSVRFPPHSLPLSSYSLFFFC